MSNYIKGSNLIGKISKNLFNVIISYISNDACLKIIQYNKKLQKYINISLYSYQKLFIKNKIPINFKKEENKNKIISFLIKEFGFKNDKKTFENIINELIKEKESFKLKEIPFNLYKKESLPKINWNEINTNIIELDLSKYIDDIMSSLNIQDKNYVKIPKGIFPNLKVLTMKPNFIVPVSLITNLKELTINMLNVDELLFYNDIIDTEIDLNNLEKLKIIMNYNIEDEDNNNEEDEEEEDEKDIEESEDKKQSKEKKVKPLRILNQENKIKFHCPNLKILIVQIKSDSDFSFLYDYFDFKYLYNIMNEVYNIEDEPGEVYKHAKQKIFNYNIPENLQYFKFTIVLSHGNCEEFCPTFKMKKFKNGLKKYSFKLNGVNDVTCWVSCHEKYEENEHGHKILKYYQNVDVLNNQIDIDINNLNVIKIKTKDKDENFDMNELKKLYIIKENNYSVQEIGLDKEIDITFFENISKFRMLKKIVIGDIIRDKKILFKFIEELSKLYFLEKIGIMFYEELTKNDEKFIKNKIKNIKVKQDGVHYEITKNFYIENFDEYFKEQ